MLPVKVCGLTRVEDALLAAELGAAAVGFIFYPKSARCVDADLAKSIGEQLPSHVARVGVFVNPDLDSLSFTAEFANLTHVQLHGEESPALCKQSPLPVIKAIRSLVELNSQKPGAYPCAAFLVDARKQGEYGGTGLQSDWEFCRQLREHKFTLLAGGIAIENVAAAVAAAQPDAIDLSSSVEQAPGIKDANKLRQFFEAVANLNYDRSRLSEGFSLLK